MKLILKISLVLLFISTALCTSAQKYAIEGGYTNPMRTSKIGSSNGSTTFFYGGKLGGTARFEIAKNTSFLTGALYSLVYADRLSGVSSTEMLTYKTTGHFIDIPLHAIYSLPISKNTKFFAYAGPTINVGIAQNMNVTSSITTPSSYNLGKFNVYKDPEYKLNRLNLQIGLGGGIQWKKYQLKSGYDFGITNLSKVDTSKLYQKGWFVTFSYEF